MGRVQRQDRGAFSVLAARHLDAIHTFIYRMTRNHDDAADLTQETFLRVWSSAATWRPGRVKFSTWLHRIARNLCIDAHRRRRETVEAGPNLKADGSAPEDAPALARVRTALDRALSDLPERQRTALVLCHGQSSMTNRDAAAVLGVSVDALESLLARARRTLRRELREYRP